MDDSGDSTRMQADPSTYSRRGFMTRLGIASGALTTSYLAGKKASSADPPLGSPDGETAATERLFPPDLASSLWEKFSAAGFAQPVSGVIYLESQPPCCGVPLGGISTGCIDLDAQAVYGFSSIFNPWSARPGQKEWRQPRKAQSLQPILGLSVRGKTWVLTTQRIIDGGDVPVCTEPANVFAQKESKNIKSDTVHCPKLEGVQGAREVHYWGHYPVADLEFETDAPVCVGLRAWAPFIPGDTAASNIPAAVFEVHLRNSSSAVQQGTIAFNFPGPDGQEALGAELLRRPIEEDFRGVMVASEGGVNYALGVMGEEKVRVGAGLNRSSTAWSKIASELPQPAYRESRGVRLYQDSSCSAAVDFSLQPGKARVVRFLLTWYAPVWEGAKKDLVFRKSDVLHPDTRWLVSRWSGDTNYYTHMYAARYGSALDVARRMAEGHASLLGRVLAWQSAIYTDAKLPPWLRDSLVNNLALVTEDSMWAQAKPPLGDWAYPGGAYALIESPRGCPDLSCIPCDWYGNLPIVYFFPELAWSTLKAYKEFQREDGAAPFWLGNIGDLPDFVTPSYAWQISLNGTCYVDLVDRVWQRTGDDAVLREFYDSVKKCNTMTMNLRRGPGGVISMPEGNKGMEWFEFGEWAGMCAHLGGLHLAQLRMMERMARHLGDEEYVKQCQAWLADGQRAMEEELWTGNYYLNFYEKETGKKSDEVMGYQLDGEWATVSHGLPGVFKRERVQTALETIKKCNIALTPEVGAANFTRPDGSPLPAKSRVAAYGPYSMFTAEVVVLGMTYIYAGQKDFGLDLVRRHWENLVCRQRHPWDLPNMVRGDTGERTFGTDYYQAMMLWALPAAIAGQDLASSTASGSLVDRVIRASERKESSR